LVEVLESVAEGRAPGYEIRDIQKLRAVCIEYGISTEDKEPLRLAEELAYSMKGDFGTR
jgi:carbon-monoxide dehydrogenase catalytic subunit